MPNRQSTPTPNEIRGILKEVSTTQKETAQQMKAHIKEAEKRMKEADKRMKETDRQIKEMSKEIKRAQNLFITQWGRLVESLVEGDLVKLLSKKGVEIQRTSTNEKGLISYTDEKGNKKQEYCEIDIIAKNGKEIVAVEVKTTLRVKDVNKFLNILKIFSQLFPEYRKKKLYGAVAYLRSQDSSEVHGEKKGLFVIRATGSSSSIINKKGFKPKIF